jgi:hypothetical protein
MEFDKFRQGSIQNFEQLPFLRLELDGWIQNLNFRKSTAHRDTQAAWLSDCSAHFQWIRHERQRGKVERRVMAMADHGGACWAVRRRGCRLPLTVEVGGGDGEPQVSRLDLGPRMKLLPIIEEWFKGQLGSGRGDEGAVEALTMVVEE